MPWELMGKEKDMVMANTDFKSIHGILEREYQ